MDLNALGWHPFFSRPFDALDDDTLTPARVARQDRERYVVLADDGAYGARVTGKMRSAARTRADFPAVGDWVAVRTRPDEGAATIHALLPRRSSFARKVAGETTEEQVVAANVDTVFLVSGLDGDFNLRRIERYVTLAWNSGALPVIVLNKADLCDDPAARLDEVAAVAMGVDLHLVSAASGAGLDALGAYLRPGTTVALLGSSGVGKSTLVNHLLGAQRMKTGAVREDDSRGRHVTTHRELMPLPGGGLVIDTPGMRELQLWADEDSLQGAFADVEALAAQCRFRDCSHEAEPGCAVRDALEDGTLPEARFQSYLKLKRELAYLARRQREVGSYEERKEKQEQVRLFRQYRRFKPRR